MTDPLRPDRTALRRMKRRATGLLALSAAVFLASLALPGSGPAGYLRAAAEAGTVGGLADWFAVTALFRHPLGLPVPHTALVPRKKDELAASLGAFVSGNFFTADAVATQVVEAGVVGRVAAALAVPATARAAGREVAAAVTAALDTLDARRLTAYVLELARRDLDRRSYAPVLAALLDRAVRGQAQRPLVDVAVTRLRAYLLVHADELRPQVKRFIEEQGLLGLVLATDKRVDRLVEVAVQTLGEVQDDPDHPLRGWLTGLLESLADDLRYKPAVARALDARLGSLVEDPQLQLLVHDLLDDTRASVRASLVDPGGDLGDRLADLVQESARRVAQDPDLQRRLQDRMVAAVRYAALHYGDSAAALISRTVAGWEARDAADRIEASVGRDLQFVRINGTVVGALAGVALHTVAVLL